LRDRKPTPARPRSLRKPVEADLGFAWAMANSVLLGLALAALVAGYVALSRGSTTLAPVLLVTGYCVLVPASLLYRGRNQGSGE
jgi:uncharacterized membrane protein YjjB (DUF3815 family)